jgi:hypothetical protein
MLPFLSQMCNAPDLDGGAFDVITVEGGDWSVENWSAARTSSR